MFAAAHTAANPYDLIVWDISMPDFSGLRAAGLIRDAADSRTKFLFYSGRDAEGRSPRRER
jgi:DNA-binding response OmpR family regulator